MIWSADRSRHQGRVVAGLYGQAAGVPGERRAVLAGGLRGADKKTALDKAGVDRSRFLLVSVDTVLAELARRSLIPVVAGLAPLEGAQQVHAEARYVAKRLTARAMAAGATSVAAPEDKPYQERAAGIKDSFGNTWYIATYTG